MNITSDRFSDLPENERPHAATLRTNLESLYGYVFRFDDALALFDYCLDKIEPVLSDDMRNFLAWQHVACRDASVTIWHFANAIKHARQCLARCPSLSACADHDEIKRLEKRFGGDFPHHKQLRHVAGHLSDMLASETDQAKHFIAADERNRSRSRNTFQQISGREYAAVFEKQRVVLEMSQTTRSNLARWRDEVIAAYGAILEAYRAQ